MTRTKAIKILQLHGFEFTSPPTARSYHADIHHPVTGSHIYGRIYKDSMNIQPTLKAGVEDLWFNFGEGSRSIVFERAVVKLEEEIKHYDEILRQERVESIKKYFNEMRMRK